MSHHRRDTTAAAERAGRQIVEEFERHQTWAEACLSVRNKQGELIPYRMGPAQIKVVEAIEDRRRKGIPARIASLKARQVWESTAIAGYFFQRAAFEAGQKAVVLAHLLPNAELIFGYYQTFQQHCQPFWDHVRPAALVSDSSRGLKWANDSSIDVKTAENLKLGRGFKARFIHASEYAFYRDAATLMTGLLQTVPDDADTAVVIETTANGVGNPFHVLWERAVDTSIDSEWIAVFFAWWEHPEYARDLDISPERFEASLSREERDLQARFRLGFEQLYWRRWAIENKCQGDVERFRQEYPAFPEEAFRASGRAFFSFKHLGRMPTIEPVLVGELEEETVGVRKRQLYLQPADRGALAVYRKPEKGHLYAIGADQAYGLDINMGEGTADPDYSSGAVLDIGSGEQVAQLRARFTPTLFGRYVEALARWYNNAFVVPEGGALGKAMIEEMLRLDFPPSLIFAHRPDLLRGRITSYVLGYQNNSVTRPQLLSKLQRAVLDMSVIIRDRTTLQQFRTFVIKPDGKPEHQQGCHDDDVFAVAFAVVGILTYPAVHTERPEAKIRKYRKVAASRRR